MASMFGRLIRLARTPQGRKLLGEAQKVARNPDNRRRLETLRARVGRRR